MEKNSVCDKKERGIGIKMNEKRKKIVISKIFIKKCHSDLFGQAVRLCAMVTMNNANTGKLEEKECFFEFEQRYEKYICTERSDAFVLGLLTCALETGSDIEFSEPISERLHYQLTEYYIPMLGKYNGSFPICFIRLNGPRDGNMIRNESAAATGCSGGVDSFYTIKKYLNDTTGVGKLTHLVFSSSGTLDYDAGRIKNAYKKNMFLVKDIADECGIDYIWCFNNLHTFYKMPYKGFSMFYTTTYTSVAFALQKLISVYYVSSGDPITRFSIDISKADGHDCQVFDVFTVSNMNTENMQVYSSGAECSRVDKEKYIADYIPAQKFLTVCVRGYQGEDVKGAFPNCSRCQKCLRTMSQFYALGVLDNFRTTFDVDSFIAHAGRRLGEMMALNKSSYVKDMKETAKENGIGIPLRAYLYKAFWYKPVKLLRKAFRNFIWARKFYYRFKIDYLLDGYRSATYELYKGYLRREETGNEKKNITEDVKDRGVDSGS